MTLTQLQELFGYAGCKRLYAKPLAENDNSKNQVYFGPDFQSLNLFPNQGIHAGNNVKHPIFKAKLKFGWLLTNGAVSSALGAQLILYPQYPEVRFSGFLKGCHEPPSELMAGRIQRRVLFLGVTSNNQILGFVVGPNSEIGAEFFALSSLPAVGVFLELPLPNILDDVSSRIQLLDELRRVHRLGWIDSKQLSSDGTLRPCNAPQCGGFTLEAELNIPKNSDAEPDFLGWEVKQHTVTSFDRAEVGTITLMTPEPTGGFYEEQGVEAFVRRFGYADKKGRVDRMNFGGVHKDRERHPNTHLTMKLIGYDYDTGRIVDSRGSVALVNDASEIAASWAFDGLLTHWTRKHARAVYVPSLCRKEPRRQYSYGHKVRLATSTDFLRLLKGMAMGSVYYDPGIKLEHASTTPQTKRRSQFRIASRNIPALYELVETVSL